MAQVMETFCLLANCFLFFCRDSAVFIFQTLLAVFEDTIQNGDRVPALWAELHIADALPTPLLFYFNVGDLLTI